MKTETGTVELPLGEYNRLRDFETKIRSGKHLCIRNTFGIGSDFFYTDTDMMNEVIIINERQKSRITELENEVHKQIELRCFSDGLFRCVTKMTTREFKRNKKDGFVSYISTK